MRRDNRVSKSAAPKRKRLTRNPKLGAIRSVVILEESKKRLRSQVAGRKVVPLEPVTKPCHDRKAAPKEAACWTPSLLLRDRENCGAFLGSFSARSGSTENGS
jgi:hypothetical protein